MAMIARSRISDGSRTNANAGENLHHAIPAPIMISGTAHEVAFAAGRDLGEIRGSLLSPTRKANC